MAQSNQPFKRPNLSENEEYQKIPPPQGQKGGGVGTAVEPVGAGAVVPQQASPPSQEEINWAIQLEDNVQKKGYKPTDQEMARYQEIANRIVMFQQAQAQAQKHMQMQTQNMAASVAPRKKSKFWFFIKTMFFIALAFFFWAKVSVIALEPSYFTPRGKIYFVIKPVNFTDMYFSLNMDKVYDEKLRKGFTKNDLNIEQKSSKKSKAKQKVNANWYKDPQYWENNYFLSLPYPKFNMDF